MILSTACHDPPLGCTVLFSLLCWTSSCILVTVLKLNKFSFIDWCDFLYLSIWHHKSFFHLHSFLIEKFLIHIFSSYLVFFFEHECMDIISIFCMSIFLSHYIYFSLCPERIICHYHSPLISFWLCELLLISSIESLHANYSCPVPHPPFLR